MKLLKESGIQGTVDANKVTVVVNDKSRNTLSYTAIMAAILVLIGSVIWFLIDPNIEAIITFATTIVFIIEVASLERGKFDKFSTILLIGIAAVAMVSYLYNNRPAWLPPNYRPTSIPSLTPTIAPQCTPVQSLGWVSYVVKEDDNLLSLAIQTGTTSSDIREKNCLGGDIKVGQTIFLPTQPNKTSTPTSTATSTSTPTPIILPSSTPTPTNTATTSALVIITIPHDATVPTLTPTLSTDIVSLPTPTSTSTPTSIPTSVPVSTP